MGLVKMAATSLGRARPNIERYATTTQLQLDALTIEGVVEILTLVEPTIDAMGSSSRNRVILLLTRAIMGPLINVARSEQKIGHTLARAALNSVLKAVSI